MAITYKDLITPKLKEATKPLTFESIKNARKSLGTHPGNEAEEQDDIKLVKKMVKKSALKESLDESYHNEASATANKLSDDAEAWEKSRDRKHPAPDVNHQCKMAHERAAYAHSNALMHHKTQERLYQDKLDDITNPSKEENDNLSHLISMHNSKAQDHRIAKNYHQGMAKY